METIETIIASLENSTVYICRPCRREGSFGDKTMYYPHENSIKKASKVEILVEEPFTHEIKKVVIEGNLSVGLPIDKRYPAYIIEETKGVFWEVNPRIPEPRNLSHQTYHPMGICPSNFDYYPNPRWKKEVDGINQIEIHP